MPEPRRQGGWGVSALQYQAGDSPLHRLGALWKLALALGLTLVVVWVTTLWGLGLLLALDLALYRWGAGLGLGSLWRDLRFFLVQVGLVAGLYLLQDPGWGGFREGLLTGGKVMLFFLPGILVMRTSRFEGMMEDLGRWLPARVVFVLFTCLRFAPVLAREAWEIALAQRLRGARLAPRQLINPLNWGDLVSCLLVPLMVRALRLADEAALSARARGLDWEDDTAMKGYVAGLGNGGGKDKEETS